MLLLLAALVSASRLIARIRASAAVTSAGTSRQLRATYIVSSTYAFYSNRYLSRGTLCCPCTGSCSLQVQALSIYERPSPLRQQVFFPWFIAAALAVVVAITVTMKLRAQGVATLVVSSIPLHLSSLSSLYALLQLPFPDPSFPSVTRTLT